jgi:hypothetical protein
MFSINCKIFLNLLLCLSTCLLSITDTINTWEYILFIDKSTNFIKFSLLFFGIIHPITLLFYYIVCLTYLYLLEEEDFRNILLEKEFYEMIFFRQTIRKYSILIIPFSLWLSIITYSKFFSFYSLKFLIERPSSYEIFFNVITTTLYNPIIIQIICQSFPTLIFQIINNIMNEGHSHSFHLRGVLNFPIIISICFILNISFFYLRDKQQLQDKAKESKHFSSEISNELPFVGVRENTNYNNI